MLSRLCCRLGWHAWEERRERGLLRCFWCRKTRPMWQAPAP